MFYTDICGDILISDLHFYSHVRPSLRHSRRTLCGLNGALRLYGYLDKLRANKYKLSVYTIKPRSNESDINAPTLLENVG